MSGEDAVTLGAMRRLAAKRLATAPSVDTPALDARILIAHIVGLAPQALVLADERPLAACECAAIEGLLARRAAGEPVARILGEREFWGLSFALSAETLVPRPDTETVVEAVLAHIERIGARKRALRIVDIGTGSGAILVALLHELPHAYGLGIDLEPGAARMARANADRLGVLSRGLFVGGSYADCVGAADILVSNPPYIESATIDTLPIEVREHDPRLALDGGSDGLVAYRTIIGDLRRVLASDGAAFFEIGATQGAAVMHLAIEAGFAAARHRDLAGHDRVIELTPRR